MNCKSIRFISVILTALSLIPFGAHLFELPHKIALSRKDYFIVQGIYRGWDLFGIVLIAAIIANLILTIAIGRRSKGFYPALISFLLMCLVLASFFIWTYPANQATRNWTFIPADWRELRRQWEYSHAAGTVLNFFALCAVVISVLREERFPANHK